MSEGLLKSIRFRDKMHLKLKPSRQTAEQYATLKTNIKTYNKIIKRLIRKLKRQYMATKFEQCKSNIKNHGTSGYISVLITGQTCATL